MKTGKRQFLLGIGTYLLGTFLLAGLTFINSRAHFLNDIDERLRLAAHATQAMVDHLHRQGLTESSVSRETDYAISMTLTEFARQANIEYVYSVIRRGEDIIFVTSNATEEELANNNYVPAYFMDYGEADDSLYAVFDNEEIGYAEYTDRWGDFRSIFIPYRSADGLLYVVGADTSLSTVATAAWQSALITLLSCLAIGLIGLPIVYLYIKSLQRHARSELERFYRCPLTGLPNRNRLLKDLSDTDIANVSVINIDKFREISTLYGPAVGDEVLKQFSLRLSRIDSTNVANYKAYRLNADEFATLVTGKHDQQLLLSQLDTLYHHVTKHPYHAGAQRLRLRVRMGAATDGEDAFTLADMALREARDTNQSMVIYDSKLKLPEAYQRNFDLTQNFRRALEEKRFQPFYQPIANTNTGEFDKYECLARMVDDGGEVIAFPDDFLPIAYRSRLYNRFTRLMLEKIFADIEHHPHKVSINLSISDIVHAPTVGFLCNHLAKEELAQRVEFEIMENQNIEDLNQIVRFIKKVQSYGCKVGLDDLGKDYSNVDRLMALPVDFVKIDGNVIKHLATDKEAQDIARMIISFAYRRKIKTVAEFCCDGKTSDMARRLGVDYLQGFHIGQPAPDFYNDETAIVVQKSSAAI